jgi:hypothetical protein
MEMVLRPFILTGPMTSAFISRLESNRPWGWISTLTADKCLDAKLSRDAGVRLPVSPSRTCYDGAHLRGRGQLW